MEQLLDQIMHVLVAPKDSTNSERLLKLFETTQFLLEYEKKFVNKVENGIVK